MFSDIAQKAIETGTPVNLSFEGQKFAGKVVKTTIVKFLREYCIEFDDGSRRWFSNQVLENQTN